MALFIWLRVEIMKEKITQNFAGSEKSSNAGIVNTEYYISLLMTALEQPEANRVRKVRKCANERHTNETGVCNDSDGDDYLKYLLPVSRQ
jgi:hypothetical protein